MVFDRALQIVHCHAEGEVGDVIVGGVKPPAGQSIWDQSRFIHDDQTLRNYVLNEPRGGVFRHVNLLVPAMHPDAQMGFIIMEPEDTPPMSGSNSICVAKVLLDRGLVPMTEPVTDMILEAPGGLVRVRADCKNGKATRIYVQNMPSFAANLDVRLEVAGLGTLTVDTAFGGDSFVLIGADELGFTLAEDEARDLALTGVKITNAANEQLKFIHPEFPQWDHFSFCSIASKLQTSVSGLSFKNAVAIQPGKIDRSPTGTALSARMAVLNARGQMTIGDTVTAQSIIRSEFTGRILSATQVGGMNAINPEISGRAWITGTSEFVLDDEDPWPGGYRMTDTWPSIS